MAQTYGPKYPGIEDGLVFSFDPKNRKSWSGGTTIHNIIEGSTVSGSGTNFDGSGSETNTAISDEGYFQFDNTDDYIHLENDSIFQFAGSFSIFCWMYFDTIKDTYMFDCGTNGALGNGYSFRLRSSGVLRFWPYNANGSMDTTDTLSTGQWYNLGVTYNNTDKAQVIYINGAASKSGTYSQTYVTSTTTNLQLGDSNLWDGDLDGRMGPYVFYNRVLSAGEVLTNYNRLKGRFGL